MAEKKKVAPKKRDAAQKAVKKNKGLLGGAARALGRNRMNQVKDMI